MPLTCHHAQTRNIRLLFCGLAHTTYSLRERSEFPLHVPHNKQCEVREQVKAASTHIATHNESKIIRNLRNSEHDASGTPFDRTPRIATESHVTDLLDTSHTVHSR